jgi:hypothetical protein
MKAVLVGTDYLEQDNSVKILEINTNIGIYNDGVEYLDFTALFDMLVSNNITEFHHIYTEDISAVVGLIIGNKFQHTLQTLCSENNISYTPYEIPRNSITIPDIDDASNKFILRQSYDVSAIFDSTYTSDKFEFFSLMSGSSYIPKTYFSSIDDQMEFDTLDSISYNTGSFPNLVEKSRYPVYDKSTYPKLSSLPNLDELNSKKQNLTTENLLQEFVYDNSNIVNNYYSVIRGISIIYGGNLDIINLGAYKHSALIPLSFSENEFESGSYTLNSKTRLKYLNKNTDREPILTYHTDIESNILMSDNTTLNVNKLNTGDTFKSVDLKQISGSNTTEETYYPYGHTVPLSYISENFEFISTSLVSVESQVVDTLMIEMSFDNGEKWVDTIGTIYYIVESGSNDETRWEVVNKMLPGDKLLTINKNTSEMTAREITDLQIVHVKGLEIFNLDTEPTDHFLVDAGNDEFAVMHNVCNYCGTVYPFSWCGNYWCDLNCVYCGGDGSFKV